jgi:O-antigen ligase
VFRSHRLALLGTVVALAAVALVLFAAVPGVSERFTTVEEGGTGRTDIWKVAISVAEDNPIVGVGIGNFSVHSPRYVDDLGPLERVDLVAEQLLVTHNAYLELLVETGIVGLLLFLTVVVGSLTAAWRAARLADLIGERSLAILAQSVFVATVAFRAGAVFISSGYDERLWVLLGLGPALLAIAAREERSAVLAAAPTIPGEVISREPTGAAAGG